MGNVPDRATRLEELRKITGHRRVAELERCTLMVLYSENRTSVPPGVWDIAGLMVLELYYNQLSSLPSEISQLMGLTYLNIHSNTLSSLPQEISQLTRLVVLDIHNNQLSSLPQEISQLTRLVVLDIHNNQLSSLPPEISFLKGLGYLVIQNNKLSSLPGQISKLTELNYLDIHNNQLSSLPAQISQLTGLNYLDIHNNQLSSLPAQISQLTGLNYLDIHNNQLSSLPAQISQLTELCYFDIHNNQLSSLPAEIPRLTRLTYLGFHNNQILSLPPDFFWLTGLISLDASINKLSSLPLGISLLTELDYLDIHNNQLSSLPAEISRLTRLTCLIISINRLSWLPQGISKLKKLESLSLHSNQFSPLPPEISHLTGLMVLDVGVNQLSSLPPEILLLTGLTVLGVGGNRLSSLPPEILRLTRLAHFDISNNPIEELPPQITVLTELKQIYIQDANGKISIRRAPCGITNLPCWSNTSDKYGGLSVADALRKLQLYDPVSCATARNCNVTVEMNGQVVAPLMPPRPTPSFAPLSRLASGKFADLLTTDFEKHENFLGKGGFGLVFKVQLKAGLFAVKQVSNASLHAAVDGTDPEKEGSMMIKLKHPNILALYDFGYRGKDFLFIMEYADGGDLCSFIKKNKALNLEDTMKYGLHIIQGLVYLHTRTPAIQHRDLKTENVLLVKGVAKLSDFGLSKIGASVNSVSVFKGTKNWSPPEAFEYGKSMGLPSDVYSYGVVLWSMITGDYPYEGLPTAEVGAKLMGSKSLSLPSNCSTNLAGLIMKCWEKNYEKRIKAIEAEKLLKEIIKNPSAVISASSTSVKGMNPAELVKYLKGKNVNPKFVSTLESLEANGEDYLELDELALTSIPFNLPRLQTKVLLKLIEEAKCT